jgi:hypothetical protein
MAPLVVPADFWTRDDVLTALRAGDVRQLFRLVCVLPGGSQTKIGIAVGMAQSVVSKVMNGKNPIRHHDVRVRIAQGLGMPDHARIAFGLAPSEAGTAHVDEPPTVLPKQREGSVEVIERTELAAAETAVGWTGASTVELVGRFTGRDLAMDRRQAVQALAAMIGGAALCEKVEHWLSDEPNTEPLHSASGVGYLEVERIEQAARLFRSWDNQFGGGLRRKAVVGQLSEVADELREHSHPPVLRTRLFAAMAQLAATAATMSWDSGLGAVAQSYYVIALRAAKEAGDREFGANILAGMARQLLYLDQPADALNLIRLAQDGTLGLATPTLAAMLRTREAWAYAAQGRVAAFRRATGYAEEELAQARPADDPYWISYFNAAELAGVTGGRLLELAHTDRRLAADAAEHIGNAIAARPFGSLRSCALDHLGLAEARLLEGEASEAARLGHHALDLVAQTHSDRVRVKLRELYDLCEESASVSDVAEFRGRVHDLLTQKNG